MAEPAAVGTNDTQTAPSVPLTREQMDALIAKHETQINAIFAIADPARQKQAVMALGIDADGIENHYKDLKVRSDALKAQDKTADQKTSVAGWASFGGGLAAMYAIGRKYITNPLVKVTAVVLGAAGISLAGRFTASRVFSGRIREESRQLVAEASMALKRELAVAFESKEMEMKAPPDVSPAGHFTAAVPERDASYAAQSATEKAQAAHGERQRA